MSTFSEIKTILDSYDVYTFDAPKFLEDFIHIFRKAYEISGDCDPRDPEKVMIACNQLWQIARFFLERNASFAAQSLLLDAWNQFSLIQVNEKRRIYRASIGLYLGIIHQMQGDLGAAMRWVIYAHADDVLDNHWNGAAKKMLHTTLGMSSESIQTLNLIGQNSLMKVKTNHDDDWSYPCAFAEYTVMRFILENPQFAHLFALPTSQIEFPIAKAYFASLINSVNKSKAKRDKGIALEDLASYLFLLIPGWLPRRNLLEETKAFESDIVVRNLTVSGNLTAELLGRHFLVECKNWEKTVGVKDVGYFLYRMRLTHAKFGIIFAKNGITGKQNEAAQSLLRKAFHEDDSTCIVLAHKDITKLQDGSVSFWALLLDKAESIRFGKPR